MLDRGWGGRWEGVSESKMGGVVDGVCVSVIV